MQTSLEQLVKAFEVFSVAVIITDSNGKIVLVNGGTETIFGYRRDELLGQMVEILMPQRYSEIHAHHRSEYNLAPHRRLMGLGLDLIGRRKNGEEFPVEVGLSPVETDSGTVIISMVHDITERKRLEADATQSELDREALQKSDERFRLAAKTGKMFAYEWDVASDVITWSGECAHILGIDEATTSFTGQEAIFRVHPDDRERVKAALTKLSPEKPYLKINYRIVRPDGTRIWVERSSRAYFNDQGTMLRVVGMVADINERKRAQQAISALNQKLIEAHEEERTRIARELHDDIGQRLALLIMNLDRLGAEGRASQDEFRDRVVKARENASNLAHDIQALSHRLHSSKLEYFGLAKAAAIHCRELSDQHNVEIDLQSNDVPDDLSREIAVCLFRVLQEALQNAIKHSHSQRFDVSFNRSVRGEICLTVHDSGIGFDSVEAIKGPGLGLISMKERLELVGGELSIESQPGKGTTVHASVPLIPRTKSARFV
jgi:PAS domain S-box-containing protein